jgi:hypothetical protein
MLLGVVVVYWVPGFTSGSRLRGTDVPTLHERRIRYAQESLFGPSRQLPGWFSREQFGTPFWANIQNFPWIPTRLVLLGLKPTDVFTAAVLLAGVLSAACTFLYARRLGMHPVGAAAAGWTFVCCGYFASRVRAGHLGILEAYWGLPLLLWLIERHIDPGGRGSRRWSLLAIGLVTASLSLAGHPQLPIYILLAACGYAMFRSWGQHAVRIIAAVFAGGLISGFVAWPMLLLIRRSSRVLALDTATSHIPLPYGRLRAFLFPWSDGSPPGIKHPTSGTFRNNPNIAYFWDGVCYVGWLPWVALLLLIALVIARRVRMSRSTIAIALIGVCGIALALPFWQQLLDQIPGTFLRSPARLLYFTSFALAMALGAAVHVALTRAPAGWVVPAIVAGLFAHAVDLTIHARAFVMPAQPATHFDPEDERRLREIIGDGRAGFDWEMIASINRTIDDVGFYDAISLAHTYRRLMALSGQPPGTNVEDFDARRLPPPALRELGVRLVATRHPRSDLERVQVSAPVHVYRVPDARPRASLADADAGTVSYHRPSSDLIELTIDTTRPTWVLVLEAFDPGWHASVDGKAIPVRLADHMFMSVEVRTGQQVLRLAYRTPGSTTGFVLSAAGALALAGLVLPVSSKRKR